MSKITEYEVASAFDAEDVLLKDGENGTMIISVENAAQEFKRLGGIDDDISGINQSVTQAMDTIDSNIAGVETDYIASKDYAIGDLFIVNNVLYKATAAIAEEDVIDTEINCAVVNLGDEIGDIRSELANKANVDGSYSTLTAGNAEQLVGTVFTEDDAAYTFRTAGGSADIGDREYDEIVGGSIVWNQIQPNTISRSASGIEFTYNNGSLHISGTSTGQSFWLQTSANKVPIYQNHVYLVDVGNSDYEGNINTGYWYIGVPGSITVYTPTRMFKHSNETFDAYMQFHLKNTDVKIDITFKPQLFDLTQMFGSEIADYIYNLEQTTPGAGVAWFRKYFPKDYYEYNAGELMHVSDLQSHNMVGFNAWDEEWEVGEYLPSTGAKDPDENRIRCKNPIPVFPNTAYYFNTAGVNINVCYYDADMKFLLNQNGFHDAVKTTPENCHFICFNMDQAYGTTYNHDICINLSWDGERDGEYEPYVKHSYPLDSSLTLRGIPKLSTDGKLYYDGDHYKSDGTVERRYGIVDLGTLNWWYQGASSTSTSTSRFGITISDCKKLVGGSAWRGINAIISTSKYTRGANVGQESDKYGFWGVYNGAIYVTDSDYTDAESFKEAMSGVYLVYELAEPTTEEAQPFQSPQIVDDFGTEEYVTSSIVPVGHITQYDSNLRAKLEMAPNSPDGDGDYLVRQTSGQNEYVPYTDGGRITALESKIPAAPSANGSYILKCTVTDGTATYAWVAE